MPDRSRTSKTPPSGGYQESIQNPLNPAIGPQTVSIQANQREARLEVRSRIRACRQYTRDLACFGVDLLGLITIIRYILKALVGEVAK